MCIINIVNHETLLTGLERLLLVLICFYIIGKIAAAVIRKFTAEKPALGNREDVITEEDDEVKEKLNTENEEV